MARGPSIIRRLGYVIFALAAFYSFYSFPAIHCRFLGSLDDSRGSRPSLREETGHEYLLLTEKQCQVTFPLLTKEIDDVVASGPFQFNRSVDDYTGQVHCKTKGGKVRAFIRD